MAADAAAQVDSWVWRKSSPFGLADNSTLAGKSIGRMKGNVKKRTPRVENAAVAKPRDRDRTCFRDAKHPAEKPIKRGARLHQTKASLTGKYLAQKSCPLRNWQKNSEAKREANVSQRGA